MYGIISTLSLPASKAFNFTHTEKTMFRPRHYLYRSKLIWADLKYYVGHLTLHGILIHLPHFNWFYLVCKLANHWRAKISFPLRSPADEFALINEVFQYWFDLDLNMLPVLRSPWAFWKTRFETKSRESTVKYLSGFEKQFSLLFFFFAC